MALPSPGWYPDPDNGAQNRYWDGHNWTVHRAPAVAPPAQRDVGLFDFARMGPAMLGAFIGYFVVGLPAGLFVTTSTALGAAGLFGAVVGGIIGYVLAISKGERDRRTR